MQRITKYESDFVYPVIVKSTKAVKANKRRFSSKNDVRKEEYIEAIKVFNATGVWPEGFELD